MTTQAEIGAWFDRGVAEGATHMLVICDTFDHDDYPLYVSSREEAEKTAAAPGSMQRLMEVYNLSLSKDEQLKAARVRNF